MKIFLLFLALAVSATAVSAEPGLRRFPPTRPGAAAAVRASVAPAAKSPAPQHAKKRPKMKHRRKARPRK